MNITQLNAISPIDGRYRNKITQLANYFSEEALIKYRVLLEIEYFIALCDIPLPQLSGFDKTIFPELKKVYKNFSSEDAQKIKDIEKVNPQTLVAACPFCITMMNDGLKEKNLNSKIEVKDITEIIEENLKE